MLEKNIYFNKILKFERGNTFLVDFFDENGASFKHNKTKYYWSVDICSSPIPGNLFPGGGGRGGFQE